MMPPVFSMAFPMLWLVRAVASAALLTSLWLTLQKWLGPRVSLAGCGGSEGCATLLDSRWSQWFFLPVTLLAATLWLAVLLLTLPATSRLLGRTADQLLAACAVLLLSGSLWFGVLMIFVVKVWCPWCAGLHLAATAVGGLLLYSAWQTYRTGERGLFAASAQAGIAGLTLLVLGQLFGKVPDTHLLTMASPPSAPIPKAHPAATDKTISYLNGSLILDKTALPWLGSTDARHLLAGFFDYTCTACRAQYTDLSALLKSAPDSFAVLVLPTPLERSCNAYLPPSAKDQEGACALARIALAFWNAAPRQFAEFHHFLMTAPLPLAPDAALAEAHRLAPKADFAPGEDTISTRLSENVAAWHLLSSENAKLPKLVLRDDIVLHGSTASRERFMEIITETFAPLPAPEAVPVSILPR